MSQAARQMGGALHKRAAERGAAIVAAMLVMTLAAILVAGLIWRADVQIRRVEAERLADQAAWIERGAVDWSRVVLRSTGDAAPNVDYPGQVWSLPIAQTRLSDFLNQIGADRPEEGDATYLSGNIEDLQARLNLRNLVNGSVPGATTINLNAVQAYARLLTQLGIDPTLARLTADHMRQTSASQTALQTGSVVTGNPEALASAGLGGSAANVPLVVEGLDQLLDIPGYSPGIIGAISPFVTVLPVATPVNANTASAQVLAAAIPGLSVAAAQTAEVARQQAYFRNTGDLSNILRAAGVSLTDAAALDVKSHFFAIHARVRHERAEVNRDTLIYRTDVVPNSTLVVSTRDAF